jgi:hypothetical protein
MNYADQYCYGKDGINKDIAQCLSKPFCQFNSDDCTMCNAGPDNCPTVTNPNQADSNSNSIGDACDCTDNICTTGTDYTGNLICDPVDPACGETSECGNGITETGEVCDDSGNNGLT